MQEYINPYYATLLLAADLLVGACFLWKMTRPPPKKSDVDEPIIAEVIKTKDGKRVEVSLHLNRLW